MRKGDLLCLQGEWVWVNSDIGVPIGARVKETPSGQRFLVDDNGKVKTFMGSTTFLFHFPAADLTYTSCCHLFQEQRLSTEDEASLKIMHPTSVEGVDDMISLGDMTEAGLLRNLLLRHQRGLIYVSRTLTADTAVVVTRGTSCSSNLMGKGEASPELF